MSPELRTEIERLLTAVDAPDPAAVPRPHLSAPAQVVIAVFAMLRAAHRGIVAPGTHLFPREVLTRPVLEELIADGYLEDKWDATCPEGHSIQGIHGQSEVVPCRACDIHYVPGDCSIRRPLVLAPALRGADRPTDKQQLEITLGLLRRVVHGDV